MEIAPNNGGAFDSRALEELSLRALWLQAEVLPHRQWLLRWIARRYPAEPDLDDVVQESFEKVLRSTDPSSVRDIRIYLSRTAMRLVIDRSRRRNTRPLVYSGDVSRLGLVCDYPLPDAVCAAREEWDDVCQAMDRLPERTRTVIHLRRIDGMPQRETAEACGLTESSIVKHLRRGLRLVRAEISPTDEGPFE